jgi:hypothetical protein
MALWTIALRAFSGRARQPGTDLASSGPAALPVDSESARITVPLLAMAPPGPDRCLLERIAAGSGWAPVSVDTCADGLALLNERSFPVVLYDRDLQGHDWRQVLHSIITSRHPACVILASRVIDTYLWEEVIQHGGFDVLSKPTATSRPYGCCGLPSPTGEPAGFAAAGSASGTRDAGSRSGGLCTIRPGLLQSCPIDYSAESMGRHQPVE